MLLHAGLADAAICGGSANWWRQVRYVLPIIPRRPGASRVYGLGCLILPHGTLFICDTQMVVDPTAEQIAEMTVLAAEAVERVRHHAEGGAAVAFQFRRERFGVAPARCAARWRCCASARRSWRWTARCTPMPRWWRRSATARCRTAA